KNNIINPYRTDDNDAVRKRPDHDETNVWRPPFIRDVERIMHNPYYNRYSDKTQVFSFYKNDDISRRSFHVQLVSRIARNIASTLGLNVDLTEAIALGHDIGHTPFGHAGERMLSNKLKEHTKSSTMRYFNHNVHSVRVLNTLVDWNISMQVLDGAICHNGELELSEYRPLKRTTFKELEDLEEKCNLDETEIKRLIPCTLEGCVVRVSDIIAYIGKDRQDAMKLGILPNDDQFGNDIIGKTNAEIINNMIVNIVKNSYGKDYLMMDKEYFDAFSRAKKENYELIYLSETVEEQIKSQIEPMFDLVYEEILKEASSLDKNSIFYKHHIDFLNSFHSYLNIDEYLATDPNIMTVDFLASMTDDYFIDLYNELFPHGKYKVKYKGYF
ncbi:MAG: HD domain-containing protein, partial [Lachnospiraceae bacterium]|nr:HD domain-containing protein [Lachnospiraceae bacterium]